MKCSSTQCNESWPHKLATQQDNVALIAVLEAIEPGGGPPDSVPRRTLICVANTHIHSNPELNDVKLWQVHTLLKGLEKIAARYEPASPFEFFPADAVSGAPLMRCQVVSSWQWWFIHPKLILCPLQCRHPDVSGR